MFRPSTLLRLYRQAKYLLCRQLFWRKGNRPSRMYRNGRGIDGEFPPTENLFFRCALDETFETTRIKPAAVRFPDQSVNRERYSRCTDVLIPDGSSKSQDWILLGVARVHVKDVPRETQSTGKVSFRFTVEHDPEDNNYGHSELRVYKNEQRETNGKVNATVKKEYRTKLALAARVIVRPLI